jgi:hypothetical protein
VLWAIEIVLALALSALLVGWHVRVAGWVATFCYVAGFGFVYATGKIDHSAILASAPLILALAGWGGDRADRVIPVAQWAMRLLALLIGVGLFTAGSRKLYTGWLDPTTHAALGHFVRGYVINGRDDWLAPLFLRIPSSLAWEPMDVATVLLECLVIVSVLRWGSFRVAISLLAIFHVGVLLMMNIVFVGNVLVYGAFVSWRLAPGWPTLPTFAVILIRRAAPAVVVAVAAFSIVLGDWRESIDDVLGPAVVFTGGAVGVVYLASRVRALLARPTSSPLSA